MSRPLSPTGPRPLRNGSSSLRVELDTGVPAFRPGSQPIKRGHGQSAVLVQFPRNSAYRRVESRRLYPAGNQGPADCLMDGDRGSAPVHRPISRVCATGRNFARSSAQTVRERDRHRKAETTMAAGGAATPRARSGAAGRAGSMMGMLLPDELLHPFTRCQRQREIDLGRTGVASGKAEPLLQLSETVGHFRGVDASFAGSQKIHEPVVEQDGHELSK